jgi:hypothetical protein
MPVHRIAILTLLVLAASCGDSVVAPAGPPPPPEPGVWHLTLSDGQAPPALVGHRVVQGNLEQIFADSAQLKVESDGGWTLTSWLQTYRNGQPYLKSVQSEVGSWAWQDTAYVFTSDEAHSRGWMRDPSGASHTFLLRYVSVEGIALSTFRREAPAPAIFGNWRAAAIGGEPLPRVVSVDDAFDDNGVIKSIHFIVDSARIGLHPTGQYTHRVWFSEWEGPPGGAPTTKRFDWLHGDFGFFVREGTALATESNWLQNHRMTGTLTEPTQPLHLVHGFSHGETPAPFQYVR